MDALLAEAQGGTSQAFLQLEHIAAVGKLRPVPAELFTAVRRQMDRAGAAVMELERLAKGGPVPAAGGLPDKEELRNRV